MSLFVPLQTGCLIALAMLLLLAAWQDLRTMHIADTVSVAIVAAFALWALSGLARGLFPSLLSAWRWPVRPSCSGQAPQPSLPVPWAAAT